MAPWPQRLNPNTATSSGPSSSAPSNANKPLPPAPLSAINFEIPTLRSNSQQTNSGTASLNHSRSFSHPFPAFFGGGRKPDKKNATRAENNIYDTTDDDTSINGDSARPNGNAKSPSHKISQKGNKEPVTGKCMTCDSTVRWPQGLKVYRCTICMTINDLEPYTETHTDTGGGGRLGPSIPPRKRKSLNVYFIEYVN